MGISLHKVTGDSMRPGYCSGDYVLAFRRAASEFKVGDVVVLAHPALGRIIKRIKRVETNAMLAIEGDNHARSTDSEVLGRVSVRQVIGKVIWRISPRALP